MADSLRVFDPGWRATDTDGSVLSGALIDFFLADTSTPDAVYSDADLTVSLGATVTCDSGGLPVSDSNVPVTIWRGSAYRVRLRRADGTTVWDLDDQAGPVTTAVTSALPIGFRGGYAGLTLPNSLWVMANGKTIGSASSNATARASDSSDTLALYTLFWYADQANNKLTIYTSAGSPTTKGATPGADFLANKALSLPDFRDKFTAYAGNMGGLSSANLLTGLSGGIDGDIPFNTGGGEIVTLTEENLPVIDPDDLMTDLGHRHFVVADEATNDSGGSDLTDTNQLRKGNPNGEADQASYQLKKSNLDATLARSSSETTGITFDSIGSAAPINNVPPAIIEPAAIYYAGNP